MSKVREVLGGTLSTTLVATLYILSCSLLDKYFGWNVSGYSWLGFVSWTTYFFMGINWEGVRISIPTMIFGAVLAWLSVETNILLGLGDSVIDLVIAALITGLLSFIVAMVGSLSKLLSSIPAIFIGVNMYFGSGNLWMSIIMTLVGQLILGPAFKFFEQKFNAIILPS